MRLLKCAGILVLQVIAVWMLAVLIRRYGFEYIPRCPTLVWNALLIAPIPVALGAFMVVFRPPPGHKSAVFGWLATVSVAIVMTCASTVASFAVMNVTDSLFQERYERVINAKLEKDDRFGRKRIVTSLAIDEHSHVFLRVHTVYDSEEDRLATRQLLLSVFTPYRVKPELRFEYEFMH